MSNSWLEAYGELRDFVAKRPGIKIDMGMIAIPGDVRPDFYRLFDTVRLAFVEQNFPDLLDKAGRLSEGYTKAEGEVVKALGLDGISMQVDLLRFLHDPKNQLTRGLFHSLFDLLKGKIDIETFGKEASGNIKVPFRNLYQSGYQKWVALSLVKMLAADRGFDVTVPSLEMDDRGQVIRPGPELIPEIKPLESKHLTFRHEKLATFIVPDFIVHSTLINRYVAFRSESGTAMWTAPKFNDKREWYPSDSIKARYESVHLKPAFCIYVDDTPESLALIADQERVCRPDLIIECVEQEGWYQEEGLETVKLHHDILKPKLGTFIASKEPVPEHILEELAGECRLLVVNLDQSKLDSIIDVLKPPAEE